MEQGPRYIPRHGSKVAFAIEAIRERPRTTRELSTLLACTCNAVRSMLLRPLARKAIIKTTDAEGRVYFSNPDIASGTAAEYPEPVLQMHPGHPGKGTKNSSIRAKTASHALMSQTPSSSLAAFYLNGELTLTVNGACVHLDAHQREQLYSYLQQLRHLRSS